MPSLAESLRIYRQNPTLDTESVFFGEVRDYIRRTLWKNGLSNEADIDDLADETLMDVWSGLPTFRNITAIQSWVGTILRHHLYRFRQERKHFKQVPLVEEEHPALPDLHTSYEGLSDRERSIIRLSQQGYSMVQIAKKQGTTENAIKQVMARLRKRFCCPVRRKQQYRGDARIIAETFCDVDYEPELASAIGQFLARDIVLDDELQDNVTLFAMACERRNGNEFLKGKKLGWFLRDGVVEAILSGRYDPFPPVPEVLQWAVELWNRLATELGLPQANQPYKTWHRDEMWRNMAEFFSVLPTSSPDADVEMYRDQFRVALEEIRQQYNDGTARFKGWAYTLPWLFTIQEPGSWGIDILYESRFAGKRAVLMDRWENEAF